MSSHFEKNVPRAFLLVELAERLQISMKGDPEISIHGINTLENAGPGELSFLTSKRYAPLVPHCRAAALLVPPDFSHLDFPLLISEQPYLCLARAAQLFFQSPSLPHGIHPTACMGDSVALGSGTSIGPLVHIGNNTIIGTGTVIHGGCHIGSDVQIGEDCLIHPNVTILDRCRLGNRVIVQSGTVIGSDGFGFAQDDQGHHVKIPQVGIVQIDDDVEIGANCTVDRATFGRTWIQRGTKIDNLVQIAHNVTVGEHSILIAQVGVSGSTRIGRHVILAGQAGIVGHIEIGDRARVGAQSGVNRSVKEGEDVLGSPALPHKEYLRCAAAFRHLPRFRDELRDLIARVRELEDQLSKE
ncbi:MAG: UDP-3-O-(3-hydroxymyristoyl)glucosamine N-acyltransferase [Deltaproteobacteria bacterium]|nr:UDP-3-O-(3-hydroxymyristoyl)glucosamine N-acyltransferase [Deltaproteobacteria bacterium]